MRQDRCVNWFVVINRRLKCGKATATRTISSGDPIPTAVMPATRRFARMFTELAAEGQHTEAIMIDATFLKAHRTAFSLRGKKGWCSRFIGRTKGGMKSKRHVVTDAAGCPISMYLSADQTSDLVGAAALLQSLPPAGAMLVDAGCDAD